MSIANVSDILQPVGVPQTWECKEGWLQLLLFFVVIGAEHVKKPTVFKEQF